jgi:peptide/nickel transport system substrate-binding protein
MFVVVAAVAALAIAGCGGSSNSGKATTGSVSVSNGPAKAKGESGAGQTRTVIIGSDWDSFDIQAIDTGTDEAYMLPAYDRLVAYGPNGKLVPYLASSWKATPTSVTFHLRTGATCDDGTKVTPDVVLASFRRELTVKKETSYLSGYFGPGPYSISADNKAGTFTFNTKTPYRNLLFGFANGSSVIICPAGLKNPSALKTGMFGSGPYELVSAHHGDRVIYKKRANWNWGPVGSTPPSELPQTLIYKIVADQSTAANLVSSGEANLAEVDGTNGDRLKSNKSLIERQAVNWVPDRLTFNQTSASKATSDQALRAAMIDAINRNTYVKTAFQGTGLATPGPLVPGSACYDSKWAGLTGNGNIQEAKKVLSDAGYSVVGGKLTKGGKPVPELTFLTPSLLGVAPEYMAQQWRQLGLQIRSEEVDYETYAQDTLSLQFDVTVSQSVQRAAGSVGLTFDRFTGPAQPKGYNFAGGDSVSDPVLNHALSKAIGSTGPASCKAFAEVGDRLLQKAYVGFMGAAESTWFGNGLDYVPLREFVEPTFLRVTPVKS